MSGDISKIYEIDEVNVGSFSSNLEGNEDYNKDYEEFKVGNIGSEGVNDVVGVIFLIKF